MQTSTETRERDGLLGVAAEYATESVPVARREQRAGEVRDGLAGHEFRCAEDVVVLERGALVGLVPIERLLAAGPGARVEEIMDHDPPAPHTDQERAARTMVDRNEGSLAVVDEDGRFVGMIPPHRMLVGLPGAMAATALVGGFERQLEANVLLAFFIPAVVYMADAVGTQTEAVLIRALATGVTVRSVIRRELLTGLVMGVVIGLAFFAFALAGWGDTKVAAAVALAIFASCSIATCVATALPARFQRLGKDPAFGSGPLATVIQDLLSIAVYLAIVVTVVVDA